MQSFQLLRYSGAHWLFTSLELMGSAKKRSGKPENIFLSAGSFTAIVPAQTPPSPPSLCRIN